MDSSARGHSGLAYGYASDLGHHDECLAINVDEQFEDGQRAKFRGRYCFVNLHMPPTAKLERNWLKPLKLDLSKTKLRRTVYEYYGNNSEFFHHNAFAFALCIPSTCSRDDLNLIVQDSESRSHAFCAHCTTHSHLNDAFVCRDEGQNAEGGHSQAL